MSPGAAINFPNPGLDFQQYQEAYKDSITHSDTFWAQAARTLLHWHKPFSITKLGSEFSSSWFVDGHINACFNAVDRHALQDPNKIAFIYEADEPGHGRKITYGELLEEVSRLSNWLLQLDYLNTGDVVTIYMPMIPEAAIAMLACSRLGLVHNVVFGGYSAESLSTRIDNSNSKLVITADQGIRSGKLIHLKQTVDLAISSLSCVHNVLVYQRTANPDVPINPDRDIIWQHVIPKQRPYCPCNYQLTSESPMFILYTSGSTGKPKGLLHTIGGYLTYATMTTKYVFDLRKGDRFGCMADLGWITGHSYVLYGPLCNGVTSLIFESIPTYPTPSRYWQIIAEHKLTQLYTAPTVIRALRAKGNQHLEGFDLSSLRILGSVGEPIHSDTWIWYYKNVGKESCTVVDTFWQTETGGIMITPLPGGMPTKPGSASLPFFGIEPVLIHPHNGTETDAMIEDGSFVKSGVLCFKKSWPGLARTIYGDHEKYLETYFRPYPGYYYTGDGASIDSDGFYYLTGRVDDVINVSGHRLSTCEIEGAIARHSSVGETAVLGEHDDITGQAICAFVMLKIGVKSNDALQSELKLLVRSVIGPIAIPKHVVICDDLPRTRSGKIMRRILRKLLSEYSKPLDEVISLLGDLTTLANPDSIKGISESLKRSMCQKTQ